MIKHLPFSRRAFTAERIRSLDQFTIEKLGIPGYTLMEIAGRTMFEQMRSRLAQEDDILVFAGKGNNGGDALVVARYLLRMGHPIDLYLMASPDQFSEDAAHNFEVLKKSADHCLGSLQIINEDGKPDLNKLPSTASHIIDGLLGTGLNSDLRGHYAEVADWINTTSATIHAVDIPTGLHPDNGHILGTAVKADHTYTFGANKIGFYVNLGPDYAGSVQVVELPFPPDELQQPEALILEGNEDLPKPSSLATHKYETGVVWIIAGSHGLTGAARMAAQSAWAHGAGAVFLISPAGISSAYDDLSQIIKQPVGENSDRHFKPDHLEAIRNKIIQRPGTVLLGPGLGRHSETVQFVYELLQTFEDDLLIDADALWALSQQSISKPDKANWLLTPHPGELRTLAQSMGKQNSEHLTDDVQRLAYLRELFEQQRLQVLSKGKPTMAVLSHKPAIITHYETLLFSRAGFGDVLSGAIAAHWSHSESLQNAIIRALLSGYQQADRIQQKGKQPEPLDLCHRS
jgi:hydroxyethylthiazole kinase-like uncharacterized protein yjeF